MSFPVDLCLLHLSNLGTLGKTSVLTVVRVKSQKGRQDEKEPYNSNLYSKVSSTFTLVNSLKSKLFDYLSYRVLDRPNNRSRSNCNFLCKFKVIKILYLFHLLRRSRQLNLTREPNSGVIDTPKPIQSIGDFTSRWWGLGFFTESFQDTPFYPLSYVVYDPWGIQIDFNLDSKESCHIYPLSFVLKGMSTIVLVLRL